MKNIIWFSNCAQSNSNNKASGSWLYSMAKLLTESGNISLTNIVIDSTNSINEIKCIDIKNNFKEYIIPNWKRDKKGLLSHDKRAKIEYLCRSLVPDIIHVWGVENYFCNIVPSLNIDVPKLLEIQGLHAPCADVYYGDMSISDTIKCLGLREILFPFKKSIYAFKHNFVRAGRIDDEVIKKYKFISTQSRWVRDYISFITDENLFQTGMSIRNEFWQTKKWERPTDEISFYCSASGPAPYKSLQTAIKALSVVKKKYPKCKLYIIGNFNKLNWIHQYGYLTFFYNVIKKYNVERNIIFTGPANAAEIIDTMHKCIGMIQTSYVESYSLALAEAQAVGIPSIISFAGAMPELATDRESGLFYSPGDYRSCASRMIELIEDNELAKHISECSYKLAHQRNNDDYVLKAQLEIYQQILNSECKE